VIYDIESDRTRKKVSEACLDHGLVRIQYSAFLGDINSTRRNSLEKRLTQELGKQITDLGPMKRGLKGKIEIITVCEKDFQQRSIIEVSV
jgi:CRISPR-associated protein Cas2